MNFLSKLSKFTFAKCKVEFTAVILFVGLANSIQAEETQEKRNLEVAESFIDVFYSFNKENLKKAISSAKKSIPLIVFYQGWAKGGNYKIVNRMPCEVKQKQIVTCSITVDDDLMDALDIDFNVTDTFHLTFSEGKITSVKTSSNDLPVFNDALEWVKENLPELIREPCRGFFDGGPTPEKCVRAMVEGFKQYIASDDFPEKYKK